jgi:hypothetical protein
MSQESTQRGKVEEWERLIQRINANAPELAYLEVPRTRLEAMLAGAREAAAQQAALKASKQEASQKLKTFQVEGERIATLLRKSLQQHYGIRSEKLAEFDLKPFRGRKRNDGIGVKPRKSPAPQPSTDPAEESHKPAS